MSLISVIRSYIHLSLNCSRNKMELNIRMFDIFIWAYESSWLKMIRCTYFKITYICLFLWQTILIQPLIFLLDFLKNFRIKIRLYFICIYITYKLQNGLINSFLYFSHHESLISPIFLNIPNLQCQTIIEFKRYL